MQWHHQTIRFWHNLYDFAWYIMPIDYDFQTNWNMPFGNVDNFQSNIWHGCWSRIASAQSECFLFWFVRPVCKGFWPVRSVQEAGTFEVCLQKWVCHPLYQGEEEDAPKEIGTEYCSTKGCKAVILKDAHMEMWPWAIMPRWNYYVHCKLWKDFSCSHRGEEQLQDAHQFNSWYHKHIAARVTSGANTNFLVKKGRTGSTKKEILEWQSSMLK